VGIRRRWTRRGRRNGKRKPLEKRKRMAGRRDPINMVSACHAIHWRIVLSTWSDCFPAMYSTSFSFHGENSFRWSCFLKITLCTLDVSNKKIRAAQQKMCIYHLLYVSHNLIVSKIGKELPVFFLLSVNCHLLSFKFGMFQLHTFIWHHQLFQTSFPFLVLSITVNEVFW